MNKKLTLKNANIAIKDGKITIEFDKDNLIEETSDICPSNNNQVELSELNPGDEFRIGFGSPVYVVVDHIGSTTKVISKEITHATAFNYDKSDIDYDKNNNYLVSDIREILNNHAYDYITNYIDKHNIVPTKCDTTAMDGSGSYGTSEENITILSLDEYRRYYDILNTIPNFTSELQWLCTPVSLKNKAKPFVCIINRDGLIEYMYSNIQDIGVRPFFTLKSSTEVIPYTGN